MQEANEEPFWTKGNLAPVHEETTVFDLPVEGSIPPEMKGLYARNGANPKDGHSGHWFFGDGMVHGVSLNGGKAEWYRNRWVRTPRFLGEKRSLSGIENSAANTNVVAHAGRIFALVENALPMEITRELSTAGFYNFGGRLETPFTAHPKVCPITGELHFFGYSAQPPYLTYHVANREGELMRSLPVPVKAPTMMHDFALSAGHVIFMDLPVLFDMALAQRGTMPFAWSDSYGARLGILPRDGGIEALRWAEIEPCYVFHVANAFEEADGTIVVDVVWYKELWRGGPSGGTHERSSLRRWRIKPGATKADEVKIDDCAIEFPRVNDGFAGLPHSAVYAVGAAGITGDGDGSLLKYDMRTGTRSEKALGSSLPSEFIFVSAGNGAGEDEGWLMGFVYDRNRNASDLLILDAQNIAGKPVARIMLPRRVPQGFHGNWLPDIELRNH